MKQQPIQHGLAPRTYQLASSRRKLIACLILLSLATFPTQAREPLTDHPLISPYEGSEIRRKDVKAFDEYNAFIGMQEKEETPRGIPLEGTVTKLFYTKPKDKSILEVFRNYEMALAASGAETLYTCNQEAYECVKRYAGPTLQKFSGLHAISNTKGRYLLAKLSHAEQVAYIAVAVGQSFTDIHVIEVKAMQTGKVILDAAALGRNIDMQGYVIVEGIYFDTDKATLKPTSTPALQHVAQLLNDRAQLEIYVVGHTDMQGAFAYNQRLSEQRAQAVVNTLIEEYGLSPTRMQAHGVGPLAPQASNQTDVGRSKNRRVVLVAR